MLSKDQANAIAESLLNQPRASRREGAKSLARPIALLYRCRELSLLEPWQRVAVVFEATKTVKRNPLLIILVFSLIGVLAFLYLQVPSDSHRSSLLIPFNLTGWSVAFLLRGIFIRREVRRISSQLLSSDSVPDVSD